MEAYLEIILQEKFLFRSDTDSHHCKLFSSVNYNFTSVPTGYHIPYGILCFNGIFVK